MVSEAILRCGFVAIVGRPNVGKSTLLNAIIGQKISITSKKPQTTRQRIRGIKTTDGTQAVYVDTPGLHRNFRHKLNEVMNRAALRALSDIDVVVFVCEALRFTEEENWILEQCKNTQKPIILVINKIDAMADRAEVLPFIEKWGQKQFFTALIPLSAKCHENIDALEQVIAAHLPEGPHHFDAEQKTDNSVPFSCTEIIREKLTRFLGQELPYSVSVSLQSMSKKNKLHHLSAVIWVAKESQKPIIIGNKGEKIKQIGQEARRDLEKFFNEKVYLDLWVKVKDNWFDNEVLLQRFGYKE